MLNMCYHKAGKAGYTHEGCTGIETVDTEDEYGNLQHEARCPVNTAPCKLVQQQVVVGQLFKGTGEKCV